MKSKKSNFWQFIALSTLGYVVYKALNNKENQEQINSDIILVTDRDDAIFTHLKLKKIIKDKSFTHRIKGNTKIGVNFEIEAYKDLSNTYKVRLKKFQITSQVQINGNTGVFHKIEQFKPYYRKEKNYTYTDSDQSFNTIEGTIYHERLHQKEVNIVLKDFKPIIKNEINSIVARSKLEAERQAIGKLQLYKDYIEGNTVKNLQNSSISEKRHWNIKLSEWLFYHNQYEKWLQGR